MKFNIKRNNEGLEFIVLKGVNDFEVFEIAYEQVKELHEAFKYNNDAERIIPILSTIDGKSVELSVRTDYSGTVVIVYDTTYDMGIHFYRLNSEEESLLYQYVSDTIMIHQIKERKKMDDIRKKYESIILTAEDAEDLEEEDEYYDVEESNSEIKEVVDNLTIDDYKRMDEALTEEEKENANWEEFWKYAGKESVLKSEENDSSFLEHVTEDQKDQIMKILNAPTDQIEQEYSDEGLINDYQSHDSAPASILQARQFHPVDLISILELSRSNKTNDNENGDTD